MLMSLVCRNMCRNGDKYPLLVFHMLSEYMLCFLTNQGTMLRSHCAWLACALYLWIFMKDLCRIRWKYIFLSDDHKEHFSLGFHWLGTFHNLPNSSWTFYSNSMTSFQPFLPLELCHKTLIQGNDWLEAPTLFPHPSTSFQDIPFYE